MTPEQAELARIRDARTAAYAKAQREGAWAAKAAADTIAAEAAREDAWARRMARLDVALDTDALAEL